MSRSSDVDACPGALRLHAAADGPLARVRVPGGLLSGAQLRELGALAASFGDGGLELTSRANIQLRALRAEHLTEVAARLTTAGLLPSASHETVRNIAAPALAGETSRSLVRDLDTRLCADPALAALPGRVLFAVGPVTIVPDVAAVPAGDGFAVLFAGSDHGLRVPRDEAVAALLTAAKTFLSVRADDGHPAWRLRELSDGPLRVARRTAHLLGRPLDPEATPVTAAGQPAPIGAVTQPDGRSAVGAAVPLSRLDGPAIAALSRAVRLVVTPERTVLVPDLPPAEAPEWTAALAAAGLAVEPRSRWSGVTACAGRPGCAKSLADVRADADMAATGFVAGLPVHWIGCARGCGSPSGPHVRAEATGDGYRVTRRPGAAAEKRTAAGGEQAPARTAAGGAEMNVEAAGPELGDVVAAARRA